MILRRILSISTCARGWLIPPLYTPHSVNDKIEELPILNPLKTESPERSGLIAAHGNCTDPPWMHDEVTFPRGLRAMVDVMYWKKRHFNSRWGEYFIRTTDWPLDLLLEKAALCLSSSYSFWPFWPLESQAYLVTYIVDGRRVKSNPRAVNPCISKGCIHWENIRCITDDDEGSRRWLQRGVQK